MSIYVMSLLVGYKPNGVDNAQARRHDYLRNLKIPIKYVFTDIPTNKYIRYYKKLGIEVKDMLCAHLLFTDNEMLSEEADVGQKITELSISLKATKIEKNGSVVVFYRDNSRVAVMELEEEQKTYTQISFYNHERLIQREIYCGTLLYTEDYVTAYQNGTAYAKRIRKVFKNLNGETSFQIYYMDNEGERYIFPDGRNIDKYEFLHECFKRLKFAKDDIIILDRPAGLDFVQPLFETKGEAKIVAFLHSGHEYFLGEDCGSYKLNKEYYTLFRYSKKLYAFLVSTENQKGELIATLKKYQCYIPRVEAIPICGIATRINENLRKRKRLVSASRLDEQKRVDWLIEAMAIVHKTDPEIELDIYGMAGETGYMQKLQLLEKKLQTQGYVHFMGYQDVSTVYMDYKVYLSASVWETMGLSLMEAAASGDALIGLNARYGNRELIRDRENGILVDFDIRRIWEEGYKQTTIQKLAEAILQIFDDEKTLAQYSKKSYEIAEEYSNSTVKQKWVEFLRSME